MTGAGRTEHADAVAAARARLAGRGTAPLRSLPPGFAATRRGMHLVAERLLKPKRELETGNEIALRFTAGGFGTPPWERGAVSGTAGQARVEGVELVSVADGREERVPVGDLAAGVKLLGIDPGDLAAASPSEADADAAAALADWYAFGTVVLADLLARHPDLDPAPIRLWPEHFDVATELGPEAAGRRANYGASPGDDDHDEPYLYVGPWDQSTEGEPWNARTFVGAELTYAEILAAEDQLDLALRFMDERAEALESPPSTEPR